MNAEIEYWENKGRMHRAAIGQFCNRHKVVSLMAAFGVLAAANQIIDTVSKLV